MFESGYDKWAAYGQAKTANVLFAVQLDALGQDAGVRAFAVTPRRDPHAAAAPPAARGDGRARLGRRGRHGRCVEFKTPEQGAATATWCATSPQLDGMGGVYCEDCDIAAPTDAEDAVTGVRALRDRPRRGRAAVDGVGRADRRERVRGGVIPA